MEYRYISSRSKELLELENQYSAGGLDPLPAFISRGKGVKIWDVDGKEYLDFVCMFGAVNQGHSHPKIIEAVIEQLHQVSLVNAATHTALWPSFAEMMCKRFGYNKIISMVSGTDAVDSACKIARKWGIAKRGIDPQDLLILGVAGCYHGLSTSMWSLQNPGPARAGYGIQDPHLINYNPCTRELLTYGDLEIMRSCIETHHARIAAVVLECIRGHLPSKDLEIAYAEGVRALCHKYNILFIADEVRMGCGKTGRFLCSDYLERDPQTQEPLPKPDLVTFGKSITGGVYPATYVLGRSECMDLVGTKEIMSTYGMSPIAIAATIAALQVIDEEGLVAKALLVERVFLDVTEGWKADRNRHGRGIWEFISYVTAVGADLGVWLNEELVGGQDTVRAICAVCLRDGLLVFPNQRRIRMCVAMVITEEKLRSGLNILKNSLYEVLFGLEV